MDAAPPAGLRRLAGQRLAAGRRARRASEFPVHRSRQPVPVDRAQLGGSAGRAHLRLHLRLAARARGAAGLRGLRLAPRRLPRLGHGDRDHGGHHRQGRRRAPRSHGDDPVLRLQHGRLLRPLARHGQPADQAAQDLPRELVPPRRRGAVPVAGLRRERADPQVDRRADPRQGRGDARRRSATCLPPGAIDSDGLDLPDRTAGGRATSAIVASGSRRWTSCASSTSSSARGCRRRSGRPTQRRCAGSGARAIRRAQLRRWRPRPHAQRRGSTPRVRPSGAALPLGPSHRSS